MAWLGTLLAPLAKPLLEWVYNKINGLILSWIQRHNDMDRIESLNKAIREKIEAAKTKDEKDAAARDLINNL